MRTVFLSAALTCACATAAFAQDGAYIDTGEYVDTGLYQGGTVETVPAPVYAAPQIAPVYVDPVPVYVDPAPVVYTDPVYTAPTVALDPYQPPLAMPTDTGWADAEYDRDRLAAFDTNGDGMVSTREAIATLRPLTARN